MLLSPVVQRSRKTRSSKPESVVSQDRVFQWFGALSKECESENQPYHIKFINTLDRTKKHKQWSIMTAGQRNQALVHLFVLACHSGNKTLTKHMWQIEKLSEIYPKYIQEQTSTATTDEMNVLHSCVTRPWIDNNNNEKQLEYLLKQLQKYKLEKQLMKQQFGKRQATALHLAALHQNIGACKLLLKYSSDPLVGDIRHNTALHYAVSKGNSCIHVLARSFSHKQYSPFRTKQKIFKSPKRSCLHMASSCNEPLAVSTLLTYCVSCDINGQDAYRKTVLFYCIENKMDAQIRLLLQKTKRPLILSMNNLQSLVEGIAKWCKNPILNLLLNNLSQEQQEMLWFNKNIEGRTCVHLAAATGNLEVIKAAFSLRPTTLEQQDSQGNYAIHYAIYFKQAEIYNIIIQWFPETWQTWRNKSNFSVFLFCCFRPCMELILHWSKTDSEFVEQSLQESDEQGNTALLLACQSTESFMLDILSCHCETSEFLQCNSNRENALHRAVCFPDNEDIVEYLLSLSNGDTSDSEDSGNNKAKLTQLAFFPRNAHSSCGVAPIHIACSQNQFEYLQLMIEYKCDINNQDKDGNTALQYSLFHKSYKCTAELLKNKNCNVSLKNNQKRSALDTAAFIGHFPSVLAIIRKMKEENLNFASHRDCYGRTPLHVAVIRGHFDIVKELSLYYSVDSIDERGRTTLHIATEYAHVSILQFLLSRTKKLYHFGNSLLLLAANTRENKKNQKRFWIAEHLIASHKETELTTKDNTGKCYLDYLVFNYLNIWISKQQKKKYKSNVKTRTRTRRRTKLRKYPSINAITQVEISSHIANLKRSKKCARKTPKATRFMELSLPITSSNSNTDISTYDSNPITRHFIGPLHVSELSSDKTTLGYVDSPRHK